MENQLELVVLGDDSQRGRVYDIISTSDAEGPSRDMDRSFPALVIDDAIFSSARKSSEFNLSGKTISYGVTQYSNVPNAIITKSNLYLFTKKNLSVVVCLDSKKLDKNGDTEIKSKIEFIKNLRIEHRKGFNIIPMIIYQDGEDLKDVFDVRAKRGYCFNDFYRDPIHVKDTYLNDLSFMAKILDISMATPVYHEIQNCIDHLRSLKITLTEESLKTDQQFSVDSILTILTDSLALPQVYEGCDTILTLKNHFNTNRKALNNHFVTLKADLSKVDVSSESDKRMIFLNILVSLAAVFASCAILPIPFVAYALYENSRLHDNVFKFFATNNIDTAKASIVKLEDEINRTTVLKGESMLETCWKSINAKMGY